MNLTHQVGIVSALLIAGAVAGCRSSADENSSAPTPAVRTETSQAAQPADAKPVAAAPMADGKMQAKIGEAAPNFALTDINGKEHTLAQYKGKTVVLEWFNPGCPYCVYAYGEGSLKTMPEQYMANGIVWLSINSDSPDRKNSSVAANKAFVDKHGLQAPLLLDPTGTVGRSYGAKSTPHMFVIDPKGVLVYQGALDNAPLGKTKDGAALADYVGDAVTAAKAGKELKTTETKSYG